MVNCSLSEGGAGTRGLSAKAEVSRIAEAKGSCLNPFEMLRQGIPQMGPQGTATIPVGEVVRSGGRSQAKPRVGQNEPSV